MFSGKREGVFVMLMKHLLYPFHKRIFLKGLKTAFTSFTDAQLVELQRFLVNLGETTQVSRGEFMNQIVTSR